MSFCDEHKVSYWCPECEKANSRSESAVDALVSCEELEIEPEWCEHCRQEFEEGGLEYTFDFYVAHGVAYCEHCGRPI